MTKYDSLFGSLQTAENKLVKLAAWVQTMSFIITALDDAGFTAKNSPEDAVKFARKFSGFSESLFLIEDGLHDCEEELTNLVNKLYDQLVEVRKG